MLGIAQNLEAFFSDSGIRQIYLKIVPVHIVPSQIVQKERGKNLAIPSVRPEKMSFRISLAGTVHSC
jgi:hypothetical protein